MNRLFDHRRLLNLLAVLTSLVVFTLYQLSQISEANAFFILAAVAVVYTGRQLAQRDGEPVGEAILDMFTRPSTYPRRAAYFAYMIATGLSLVMVTQALIA